MLTPNGWVLASVKFDALLLLANNHLDSFLIPTFQHYGIMETVHFTSGVKKCYGSQKNAWLEEETILTSTFSNILGVCIMYVLLSWISSGYSNAKDCSRQQSALHCIEGRNAFHFYASQNFSACLTGTQMLRYGGCQMPCLICIFQKFKMFHFIHY